MKTRFNIALCPDEEAQEAFFKMAAPFQEIQLNYCLARGRALAHVTLSQFYATSASQALSFGAPFMGRSLSVMPLYVYAHLDELLGEEALWVGHAVRRESSLLSLQDEVVAHLKACKAFPLQKTGNDYFPHFTLARLGLGDVTFSRSIFEAFPMKEMLSCEVHVGRSDERGQFIEILG